MLAGKARALLHRWKTADLTPEEYDELRAEVPIEQRAEFDREVRAWQQRQLARYRQALAPVVDEQRRLRALAQQRDDGALAVALAANAETFHALEEQLAVMEAQFTQQDEEI